MVIRDLMDILYPHAEYAAEAVFYETRPLNSNAGGLTFDFAYVEPRTKAYTRVFGNVAGEDERIAIRTIARLKFTAGKNFVRLPDGKLYIITEALADRDKAPKQALRLFANPIGTEYLLRLKFYADPARG